MFLAVLTGFRNESTHCYPELSVRRSESALPEEISGGVAQQKDEICDREFGEVARMWTMMIIVSGYIA